MLEPASFHVTSNAASERNPDRIERIWWETRWISAFKIPQEPRTRLKHYIALKERRYLLCYCFFKRYLCDFNERICLFHPFIMQRFVRDCRVFTFLYSRVLFLPNTHRNMWHEIQDDLTEYLPYSHVDHVWQRRHRGSCCTTRSGFHSRERREAAEGSDYFERCWWSVALSSLLSSLFLSLSLSLHGWRWKSMLNREERTAADGEETKEAFYPSSLLHLLHAFFPPISISVRLPRSPLFPFIPFLSVFLSLCLTWYLFLSSLFSPIFFSFFLCLLLSPPPVPPPSSVLLFSHRSFSALCWNRICHCAFGDG